MYPRTSLLRAALRAGLAFGAVALVPLAPAATAVPAAAPAAPRVAAADEGIALGRVERLRVTGRVFDSRTGQPLPNALVTVEGPYRNDRTETGPDGTYSLLASADGGLGTVSVAFAHADYQQKYLETLFRGAFPGRVEVSVQPNGVRVKAKGADLRLACGGTERVPLRSGDGAAVAAVCEEGLAGATVELRRNRVGVLARAPYSVRVEDGRLEVRDAQGQVELRVDAAMLPR